MKQNLSQSTEVLDGAKHLSGRELLLPDYWAGLLLPLDVDTDSPGLRLLDQD